MGIKYAQLLSVLWLFGVIVKLSGNRSGLFISLVGIAIVVAFMSIDFYTTMSGENDDLIDFEIEEGKLIL